MGQLVVSENITLDGVMQDPTGEEGVGGWFSDVSADDRSAFGQMAFDEAVSTEALLFGRRGYEWFAARWPLRTGPWADRLTNLPKYVVSASLADPGWHNSTVLRGDAVEEVTRLKHRIDGDIVVYASGQLVKTLMEHDLVDELRLTFYPCVLGRGTRLFDESAARKHLRLIDARVIGDALALLTYKRTLDA